MISNRDIQDGQRAVNRIIREAVPEFPMDENIRQWSHSTRKLSKEQKKNVRNLLLPLLKHQPWDGIAYYAAGELYSIGYKTLELEPMINLFIDQEDTPERRASVLRGKLVTLIAACARPKNLEVLVEFFKIDKPDFEMEQVALFMKCWEKNLLAIHKSLGR